MPKTKPSAASDRRPPKPKTKPSGRSPKNEVPSAPPDERWEKFLECIRKIPDRTSSLSAFKISHAEFSDKLRDDEKFAAEYARAFDAGIDSLEDEGIRRAMLGVDEPVFHQGFQCGSKTRYSDTLLMFFLEANRAKYRTGADLGRRPLSDESKSRLRTIFASVREAAGEISPPAETAPTKRRGKRAQE